MRQGRFRTARSTSGARCAGRAGMLCAAVFAFAVTIVPVASASHSWGSPAYHWPATSLPLTLNLGNNLGSDWAVSEYGGSYLDNVHADWSASAVLDTTIVTGANLRRCGAVSGRIEVCSDTYGANGWLGVASIWLSGSHIAKATVKMNDTYFNSSPYATKEWRRSVLCQEVGHTFGLGHQSEDWNVNTGSCMDYYKVPNIAPNVHDYAQLGLIYNHSDQATTKTKPGNGNNRRGGGLTRVREGLYVEDLGGDRRRAVFVFWRDQSAQHLRAPDDA